MDNHVKACEKATLSINQKPTVKAYYRRGKSYYARKNFDKAVEDFEEAIKLDPTDPNSIKNELN